MEEQLFKDDPDPCGIKCATVVRLKCLKKYNKQIL